MNRRPTVINESRSKQATIRYDWHYKQFLNWCSINHVKNYSECVVLAYFCQLSKKYSSSTLWSVFFMLKATLYENHIVDIAPFNKVRTFIRKQMVNNIDNPSLFVAKTFSDAEITKFLIEAPDRKYLMMKVALIIGVACACKTQELANMLVSHVVRQDDALIIEIPAKTYWHRKFTIRNSRRDVDVVAICNNYFNERPKEMASQHLFYKYTNGLCIPSRTAYTVSYGMFAKIPAKIAEYLKLEKSHHYTGFCFNRTSAALRLDLDSGSVGSDVLFLSLRKHRKFLGKFIDVQDELPHDLVPTSVNINQTIKTKYLKLNKCSLIKIKGEEDAVGCEAEETGITEIKLEIKPEPNFMEGDVELPEIKPEPQDIDELGEYVVVDINRILQHSTFDS